MDYTVCSREFECDYEWGNSHASHLLAECAQAKFAPALEGSITTSRFAALLRCADSLNSVVLCVSVSTKRIDFRNRPIRTMAYLRAEKPEEADLLARFFAECLRKPDAETIYNAESGVAKAVESLYQTKKLDDFMQFCRSLPTVNGGGVKLADRWAIPRGETADRSALVESLPALIGDNAPFLLALTDRLPTDVLASLGSMFDHATVRIFSKAIDRPEKLSEPVSQKYVRAAAIGCVAILAVLVAAIGSCSRGCGKVGDNDAPNDALSTGGGGTNAAPDRGIVEANDQTDRTCGGTSSATDRVGSGGLVTPATTNTPPQETVVTNSLTAASANDNRKGRDGQ